MGATDTAARSSVFGSILADTPLARWADARSTVAAPASAVIGSAWQLNWAAGVIAASVLADSAMEHYRGDFHNPAMVTPLVTAAASIAVSLHGLADAAPVSHTARDVTYAAAAAVGVVGTGFHVFNVTKRVGGLSWQNLFYAAPLGAPMAMTLSSGMPSLWKRSAMVWLPMPVRCTRGAPQRLVVELDDGRTPGCRAMRMPPHLGWIVTWIVT